jgi:tetratricopeptide (TPR) repeat protein
VAAHPLTVDCHRGSRGPYTGVGNLIRAIFPDLEPDVISRHAIEIAAVAPELRSTLDIPVALISSAPARERVRWHSRMRTRRIAHGIIDLLRAHPVEVTFTGVDHADPTDLEFLSLAARRRLAFDVVGASTFRPEAGDPSYHDGRAALLEKEFSLCLGEVLYHRRRGTSATAAVAAYREAIEHCIGEGFYDAALALVEELAPFAAPADHHWVATRRADILFLLGRPEAEPLDALPFHLIFVPDGQAPVEMHLDSLAEALDVVTSVLRGLGGRPSDNRQHLRRTVLRHHRARLLAALCRLDEARAEFDRVVEQDPFFAEYRVERANLLQRMGKHILARADYEVAMRLSPPWHELYYNHGDLLCTLGDVQGAIADFRYVLDLEPDHLEARLALAALLPPAEAAELLRDSCEISSGGEPRLQVAWGLSLMDDEPAAARAAFDAALALDPGNLEALVNRAVLAFEGGDVDAALADLGRALELCPGHPDVLYNRGFAYEKAGRTGPAEADYRSALDRWGADREALLDGLARCEAAVGCGERVCK